MSSFQEWCLALGVLGIALILRGDGVSLWVVLPIYFVASALGWHAYQTRHRR